MNEPRMNLRSRRLCGRPARAFVGRRSDAGLTLVEVLLTVAILAIVMIPLLLWTGLVIRSGSDTSGSDNTNVMTEVSNYLSRDVSGVTADFIFTPGDAEDAASQAKFDECGMPLGANTVLELGREDSWIVYYTTKDAKNVISLSRLRCTGSLTEPVLEPGEEPTEWSFSSVIAEKLDAEPAASYNGTEVHMTVDPPNLKPISVRVERNVTTDPLEEPDAILIPIVDCAPSCTVNRKGSALGSDDPTALTAVVKFNARLSKTDSVDLPITHYQWVYGDGTNSPITSVAVSPLNTEFSHTYTCRSIGISSGQQQSTAWDQSSKACQYNAALTVWSGGAGASPVPGSTSETAVQRVEVKNNVPLVVVNPQTVVVSSGAEATMSAAGTTDIDGKEANLTYSWDFGDPNTGTNNFADTISGTHRYDLPVGTTTEAVLTVTDDDGESVQVKVPVLIDVAEPLIIMDIKCRHSSDATWTHFDEDCLKSDREPWIVKFIPSRTAVSAPGASIVAYRWEIANIPGPWTTISGGIPDKDEEFQSGATPVHFSVRTNQTKLDGSAVEADWYASVDVNVAPSAIARFLPDDVITPSNRNIAGHENDAARFVLDGSSSIDQNPGGSVTSYVWEVFNSSGTKVYTTPAQYQDRPIIGCTGFQTPPAQLGDPWTVSDNALNGSSLACPPFMDLPAGNYTATITVENNRGKSTTSTPPSPLKVNLPPNQSSVDVPNGGKLNSSYNSTCYTAIESTPSACVYRKLGRLFTATTPTDSDGSPLPFKYKWELIGDQGSTFTSVLPTITATFLQFGENVDGKLTVTDGDGGITERTFRFTVQNQNPNADIGVVSPGPAPSPAAKFPLNVFSDLTPADPGTVILSSGVTADVDTSAAMTCRWECVAGCGGTAKSGHRLGGVLTFHFGTRRT